MQMLRVPTLGILQMVERGVPRLYLMLGITLDSLRDRGQGIFPDAGARLRTRLTHSSRDRGRSATPAIAPPSPD